MYVDAPADNDNTSLESFEKYLKLFYLDDTESEAPVEKHLPGCPIDSKGRLTLTAFKLYVKHLLPTGINESGWI